MKVAFGTDGIRGRAGTWPIVEDMAHAIGRVAGSRAGRVFVGGDTRPSTEALLAQVCAGVVGSGGRACPAGVVPTSAIGLAVAANPGTLGIVVTASHNPSEENGFKWIGAEGRKPDDTAAAELGVAIDAVFEAPTRGGGRVEDARAEVLDGWASAMRRALPDFEPLRGRRIAIDLANGAANAVWPWLRSLPVQWHRVDGTGRINDGFGSEHLGALQSAVDGCDAGLAVDGDADRCVLVDAQGRKIPGDALLWRLAQQMDVAGLAVTVMSTAALELGLPGVRVLRTPVGDRFVRAAMDANHLALGGEESGHLLFGDFPAGDGLLGGLRSLCAAFTAAPTLAGAFEGLTALPRELLRVPAGARRPLEARLHLGAVARSAEESLGPGGRVFLRYSGTEDVLRVLVEGVDAAAVRAAAAAVAQAAVEDP